MWVCEIRASNTNIKFTKKWLLKTVPASEISQIGQIFVEKLMKGEKTVLEIYLKDCGSASHTHSRGKMVGVMPLSNIAVSRELLVQLWNVFPSLCREHSGDRLMSEKAKAQHWDLTSMET